jgi:glutamyl-tRNA synthetase
LTRDLRQLLVDKNIPVSDDSLLEKVVALVKDRCTLLPDFYEQSYFFFVRPQQIDIASIKPKWNEAKTKFFKELIGIYQSTASWTAAETEKSLKELATTHQLKPGELMLPFRIMLVGGKFGPGVFDIAEIIGKKETIARIEQTLSLLS